VLWTYIVLCIFPFFLVLRLRQGFAHAMHVFYPAIYAWPSYFLESQLNPGPVRTSEPYIPILTVLL
jgi:hypothetical protein